MIISFGAPFLGTPVKRGSRVIEVAQEQVNHPQVMARTGPHALARRFPEYPLQSDSGAGELAELTPVDTKLVLSPPKLVL